MKHLIRKLSHFAPLSHEDEAKLQEIGSSIEELPPDKDVVAEGERPRSVFVLTSGLACRYKLMEDGRRQIMSFLVPGDICDLHVFLLTEMDHSIGTLTPTRVSAIETAEIINMFFHHPRITAALWWSMLQEEAILRERIVALGRRNAEGRLAYLLCELLWRLEAVGEAGDDVVELPLTQEELGDALSLTPSYVNRVLQKLRRKDFITLRGGLLRIHDLERLSALAGFDRSYLHLGGAPSEIRKHFEAMEKKGGPQHYRGS